MIRYINEKITYRRLIVALVAIAVILIIAIVWITTWVIKQSAKTPPRPPLTNTEKQQIFESLRLPPGTPPLTEAEKAKIFKAGR